MNNPMLPLIVRSVSRSIDGRQLLSNINLTVTDNGVTVILGHNGAGKSLLLSALHGLDLPTSGTIHWGGQDQTDNMVRARQAMMFQKPVLLRRTVAANINYVLKLPGAKPDLTTEALLDLAQLSDKSRQMARSLSGGEQQRLAFVRALATGPDVIFLDEPTANLDPDATLWIENLIDIASQRSIKIFMVTHEIAQARRLADDIILIRNGAIEEHTDSTTFFTQPHSTYSRSFIDGILTASVL